MLEDLRGQVSFLQGLASDLEQEKGKLTSMLQELKQELKEQAEQQEVTRATVEQLVTTSQQLQEQVEELRAMVRSTGQEQGKRQAVCPMCRDTSTVVGNLLQQFEKLQEQVDSLLSMEDEGKVEMQRIQDQEVLSRLMVQEQELQQVQQQLQEVMVSKLDHKELRPSQQQLDEHWKRSLEQLKGEAPPRQADSAAGIKKPIVPIPPALMLMPHDSEKTPRSFKTGESKRERAANCRYPRLLWQCGGQNTVLQPVPPSTPQPLKPTTVLPSKDDDNMTDLMGSTIC